MTSPADDQMSTNGGVWQKGQRALTTGLLLAVIFTAFEALAVATILPTVVDEIGGLSIYGWAFSAFMLANLIGITIGGDAADKHGPARPFGIGGLIFAAGLLAAGFASSMPMLVAARAFQGLGAGALGAVAYVAIGRGYSPEARPRMLAALSSAWVIPGMLGPSIAGWMTDTIGWRWVFFALAPAVLAGALLALQGLRQLGIPTPAKAPKRGERSRLPMALLLVAGATLLLVGLENPGEARRGLAAIAGLMLLAPALRSLLPPGTLTARAGLPAATLVLGGIGFIFFGAEAFVPLGLTKLRGLSPTAAGLPLSLGSVFWTAGAWIQAREAPRRSRRAMIASGLVLIGFGIAGTSLCLSPAVPVAAVYAFWSVTALGMGIAYSTASLSILEGAAPGEEGNASASLQIAMNLGIALGTGVAGAILALGVAASQPLANSLNQINLGMLAATVATLLAVIRIAPHPLAGRSEP